MWFLLKIIGFSLKISSNSNYVDYIYSKNIQNDIIRIYRLSDMTLVGEYDYDAFGNQTIITNVNNIASINPFRYRSYYYDTETNLYYLKSRYYSPELMRFLTPDRISILDDTMDNIDACNLYVYCSNNPVMYTDPDRTLPQRANWIIDWAFIIGAIVGAATGAISGALISAGTQTIRNCYENINTISFLKSAGTGALAGFIAGGIFGGINYALSKARIARWI